MQYSRIFYVYSGAQGKLRRAKVKSARVRLELTTTLLLTGSWVTLCPGVLNTHSSWPLYLLLQLYQGMEGWGHNPSDKPRWWKLLYSTLMLPEERPFDDQTLGLTRPGCNNTERLTKCE